MERNNVATRGAAPSSRQASKLALRADMGNFVELTATMYSVDVARVRQFYDTYIEKARQGPAVFWPWYLQQCRSHDDGFLVFEPCYPHEVFPELMENDHGFYTECKH